MNAITWCLGAALFGLVISGCGESAAPENSPLAAGMGGAAAGTASGGGMSGTSVSAGAGGSLNGGGGGAVGLGGQPQAGASAGAGTSGGEGGSGGDAEPAQPQVDRGEPQRYHVTFTAKEADGGARLALGTQNAYLDTRVEPLGKLVIYLHGAGEPKSCGAGALAELVAGWGFHWFGPCYVSNYGVGACGTDIGGCRLEAFEGVDHHEALAVGPADSIEGRVVAGLKRLQNDNPEGDWQYFLQGDQPRWSSIVIAGSSHGASSSGLIGMYRAVDRVVMLAGPLDTNQAWLELTPKTPIEKFFGFTHTSDAQHAGHLAAFATLNLPGSPAVVDAAQPPYGGSHRLVSSRATNDGHNAVSDGKIAAYQAVWRYMFGAQ